MNFNNSQSTDRPLWFFNIRHGHAEHNQRRKKGVLQELLWLLGPYGRKSNAESRLTDLGRRQIEITGEWIRKTFPGQFERYYCSDYTRALESAGTLNLNGKWQRLPELREQSEGMFEAHLHFVRKLRIAMMPPSMRSYLFYRRLPNGESAADVVENRIEPFLRTMSKGYNRVIAVNHGRLMSLTRYRLLHWTTDQWNQVATHVDPEWDILNGQVDIYTRCNPFDLSAPPSPYFAWFKTICPWNTSHPANRDWMPIQRITFSDEELLSIAESVPRYVNKKILPELVNYEIK